MEEEASESTPFLEDNDHSEAPHSDPHENQPTPLLPAKSYFKRPIKILSILALATTTIGCLLYLSGHIISRLAPFRRNYSVLYLTQDVTIVLFIASLVTTFTLFLPLPIFLGLAVDLTLAILIFIFAGNTLYVYGYEDSQWCVGGYDRKHPYEPLPPSPQCLHFRIVLRGLLGAAAGLAFVGGMLCMALLLLRSIAVSRNKYWRCWGGGKGGRYTFRVTLNVMKSKAGTTVEGEGLVDV